MQGKTFGRETKIGCSKSHKMIELVVRVFLLRPPTTIVNNRGQHVLRNKSESARFGRTTKTGTLYRQAWYLGVDLDLQDLIRRLFEHVI